MANSANEQQDSEQQDRESRNISSFFRLGYSLRLELGWYREWRCLSSVGFHWSECHKEGCSLWRGSGPILLDNVQCTGNESYIWNCSHRGWNVHYCSHSYDVGVDCYWHPRYTTINTGQQNLIDFAVFMWVLHKSGPFRWPISLHKTIILFSKRSPSRLAWWK